MAVHFRSMLLNVKQSWRHWVDRRRVNKVVSHFRKQESILRDGLQLYADVVNCYDTNIAQDNFRLVKLRLSIPLRDRVALDVLSATFTTVEAQTLQGLRLRIRFLPGDMSHVVICL